MRSSTTLALAGVVLVGLLLVSFFLSVRGGLLLREAQEPPGLPPPLFWDASHQVPEITVSGVTLAGRAVVFEYGEGIYVKFWLLVRDPALQDYSLRLTGVTLHSRETAYTLRGQGVLAAGGGIHFAGAAFSGYDYASSHPNVPGRNKEVSLSIQAMEIFDGRSRSQRVLQGPWVTVVAVKNDVPGSRDRVEVADGGQREQTQFGVTVRPADGLGGIEVYEVVQEGTATRLMPIAYRSTLGPYVIRQEEYEAIVRRTTEVSALGAFYDWPPIRSPDPSLGVVGSGSQTVNAIVEVGSASIPQGQQAQVPVTVRDFNDPDGLGGYDFKITYSPAVVNVVSVSGGQAPFNGTPTQNVRNPTGVVHFNAIQGSIPGPRGDMVVAYVTLQAVGSPGSSTTLDISVGSLVETAVGDDIPAVDQDGTVTIVP